ncbi:hypothetical protein Pan44_38280 [Caulifigura coniformis]|uniref:Ice-binding protein C-terminal domain-containing protein n=1 Tax=Caulifigura coniformis TaxID=2527983 RepID=A0A517SI29_9PLAN|nr:DUF4465 domain-containing protein [Caulifigura coniformis]QDT55780.1 hypothetical protein Pan44_38280 [Caulifigura coniformis]
MLFSRYATCIRCCALLIITAVGLPARAEIITFDDLPPGQGTQYSGADVVGSYYYGDSPDGVIVEGTYGPVYESTFTSGGAGFINRVDQTYGSWSGFSYSNVSDIVTPGFENQYAAYTLSDPGSGMGPGVDNYGIAFGYDDIVPNLFDPDAFDPTDIADLFRLPTLSLPTGMAAVGMYVTNTTYAALSMLGGDSFGKTFGGASGDDPDWFKLTAYGIGADGLAMAESVEFYLADYRFDDNSLDYIVDDWTWMDLSALADAKSLHFNLASSDAGDFGMNTPAYFAMDDLQLEAVPEPTSLMFAAVTGLGVVLRRRGLRKKSA